ARRDAEAAARRRDRRGARRAARARDLLDDEGGRRVRGPHPAQPGAGAGGRRLASRHAHAAPGRPPARRAGPRLPRGPHAAPAPPARCEARVQARVTGRVPPAPPSPRPPASRPPVARRPGGDPLIRLFHVSKTYETGSFALRDLSVEIRKGELVFLTGPSGAGKTTLMKLLFAAERPSEGQILVLGRNVARLGERRIPALRRRIGVVFQD